jgi:hypothetical protein
VLSILTVDIGAASPERARLLLDWLARRPEEVLVLTETSAGPGRYGVPMRKAAIASRAAALGASAGRYADRWDRLLAATHLRSPRTVPQLRHDGRACARE